MNYNAAFPNAMASMGCATTCTGYELMNKLDFDSDGDGDVDANDHGGTYWDNGAGWTPIGVSLDPYSGDFKGNGYTVDNLFISRSSSFNGLFGATHANARIETLGVTNANITGNTFSTVLIGSNAGEIVACYTIGRVSSSNSWVGGISGYNSGTVSASYSHASVGGLSNVGGLLGASTGSAVARFC